MADNDTIRVEVVAAVPGHQEVIQLQLAANATVSSALRASGLAVRFSDIDFESCAVAIWGHPSTFADPLKEGDRVEVLRPLIVDPRDARKALAEEGQFMGGAASVAAKD